MACASPSLAQASPGRYGVDTQRFRPKRTPAKTTLFNRRQAAYTPWHRTPGQSTVASAMNRPPLRLIPLILILGGMICAGARAETPPLLAKAIAQWVAGQEDLAFTQQTRFFFNDGRVKEERVERYDPALPDSQRWRLIEVDSNT